MTEPILIPRSQLPEPGQRSLWRHADTLIVVFNVDGVLYAIDDSCPHRGASLASGALHGRMLQCPAHGLKFDLTDGCMGQKVQCGMALRRFAVQGDALAATLQLTPILPEDLTIKVHRHGG